MAADAAAAMTMPPISAQVVGNAFVPQYYHILHHSPGLVHRFYQDNSKLGRPEGDGSMSITTTMQAINDKIVSFNYENYKAEINSVDAQESYNGGVQVFVTGYLIGNDNAIRHFAQVFFLAPQETGFFVFNDIFRYLDIAGVNPVVLSNVVVPLVDKPVLAVPVPCEETHTSEQISPHLTESIASEVFDPSEDLEIQISEEICKVEAAHAIQSDTQVGVGSNTKLEEVIKKSYASIVMDLKESVASFSPPVSASKRTPPVIVEQQYPANAPTNIVPVTCLDSTVNNEDSQEDEADGYSIYVRGLPSNATNSLMEEVFKKFGSIKANGVQVRSNWASPVSIGGRKAIIEEKRSTNSRGNSRGRFQYARGSEFGSRGRGNFGGGRGYNKGEFNGKSELFSRNGSREGFSSHDGYPKSENYNANKGHMNRSSWVANGNAEKMTPRVSATA